MSSRIAIYNIRSPVNPARAELSTKNSDSAFLVKLILVLLRCIADELSKCAILEEAISVMFLDFKHFQ
jgi:hypothetical protein